MNVVDQCREEKDPGQDSKSEHTGCALADTEFNYSANRISLEGVEDFVRTAANETGVLFRDKGVYSYY